MADSEGAEGPESPVQPPSPTEEIQDAPESELETKTNSKVGLLLKAAGDAPIMKQKFWMVDPKKQVTWVVQFIRRYIRMDPSESLFVYVSQAFSPSPDQTIGNLLESFGSEGKLVLHYCRTQAWG
ncbi:autophagy protein 12-like [Pollicipes pollicipes]|uniref:autophagy protein 12-like n=1 Tax=Pollicipes pollicipes TaxID=41117 RepID=UPI0018854EB0|nr:autophagy protein 12-like [Pollicipes pollicipes]XP_037074298.1 autophagy protein 12-like [Pollicipes pollicipes]XP_037074299.1 autophagy protein 12-like [Pollicipes pollicipes]